MLGAAVLVTKLKGVGGLLALRAVRLGENAAVGRVRRTPHGPRGHAQRLAGAPAAAARCLGHASASACTVYRPLHWSLEKPVAAGSPPPPCRVPTGEHLVPRSSIYFLFNFPQILNPTFP